MRDAGFSLKLASPFTFFDFLGFVFKISVIGLGTYIIVKHLLRLIVFIFRGLTLLFSLSLIGALLVLVFMTVTVLILGP